MFQANNQERKKKSVTYREDLEIIEADEEEEKLPSH